MENQILLWLSKIFINGEFSLVNLMLLTASSIWVIYKYILKPLHTKIMKDISNNEILVEFEEYNKNILQKLDSLNEKLTEIEQDLDKKSIRDKSIQQDVKDISSQINYIKGLISGYNNRGL